MGAPKTNIPEWRQFEEMVARIEADADSKGLIVTSPDRIRCKITGRLREVDASVRSKIGTTDILVTIECRKRAHKQDITWIEQLATKKKSIGAARTIAVSSSGFSSEAEIVARQQGIDLRQLSELSVAEINNLMQLDFVLFTHKRCAIERVEIRFFRSLDWSIPHPEEIDLVLPPQTDPFAIIFSNNETGATWSLNDLWLQLQEATNPFADIVQGMPPTVKTACFPFPGNVTLDTADGPKIIGDVLLSLALSIEVEQVDLESAKKVEYSSPDGIAIQRVEFESRESKAEDWRLSLQMPKDSKDIRELKTGGNWPDKNRSNQQRPDAHHRRS